MKKKYATDRMIRSHCEFCKNFISENSSDHKKLFSSTKKLRNHTDEILYPPYNDKLKFANEKGSYFIEKTVNIQVELDNMDSGLSARPSFGNNYHHYGLILTKCLRMMWPS